LKEAEAVVEVVEVEVNARSPGLGHQRDLELQRPVPREREINT
jgi:hypothetical protein